MSKGVLRISHEDEDELTKKLVLIVERRGFRVTPARPEQVSVGELARRVQRPLSTVSRSLRRPSCPDYEATRSRTGRILRLSLTPPLLAYCAEWRMGERNDL